LASSEYEFYRACKADREQVGSQTPLQNPEKIERGSCSLMCRGNREKLFKIKPAFELFNIESFLTARTM
jgi:hypothetical protein